MSDPIEITVTDVLSDVPIEITVTDAGGGSGDVVGPATSTDGAVALFDGTTGKLVKDGGALGSAAFSAATAFDAAGAAAISTSLSAGGTRCACYGDSNGLGIGWPNGSDQWFSPKSPYCQAILGSRGMLRNTHNNSVAGATSTQILARLQADLAANIAADVIIWCPHTNDYTGGLPATPLTVAQSVANFQTAMAAVLATGRTFLCLSPPPVGASTPGSPSGDEAAHQAHVRMIVAAQRNYIAGAGSSAVLTASGGYSTSTPRAFYIPAHEACVNAANGEWVTGYNTVTGGGSRDLHFAELGAKVVAQLIVDWASTYSLYKGGPLQTLYDGDGVTNKIAKGCFVGPLSGSTPPSWTYANYTGGTTVASLVAPTADDSIPTPLPNGSNWYRLTATGSQQVASISQTWSGSATVGDVIRFYGRCQASDFTGTGGFCVYAKFLGVASYIFPLFGKNATTQQTLNTGGDFCFDMTATYPTGATGLTVWFVVRPDTVSDGVGVTGFAQVTNLGVVNETALNLAQYG